VYTELCGLGMMPFTGSVEIHPLHPNPTLIMTHVILDGINVVVTSSPLPPLKEKNDIFTGEPNSTTGGITDVPSIDAALEAVGWGKEV